MNVTPIINAFIALVAAVITGILIPFIKAKTTAQSREEIRAWVTIAVSAAEQLYKGQSGVGNAKKAYVIDFLAAHNFIVDETEIDALIESEVYKLTEAFNE